MRGLCDALGCRGRARWYAVARGRMQDGTVLRSGLNFTACDEHQRVGVLQLAKAAGWDGLVNNLMARMPVALEAEWEHIGGT